MLSNYWKNKLEEEENLESLHNLYKNEVMKYKLSKAVKEQHYSDIYKPITEKLEETIKPLEKLKELSEEQAKRMLPPPPVPPAIVPPPVPPAIVLPPVPPPTVTEIKEEEDEFVDVPEQATGVEEEGAVGGVEETKVKAPVGRVKKKEGPLWEYRPAVGLNIDELRKHGFKPPSEYKGSNKDTFDKAIKDIGHAKGVITKTINNIKKDIDKYEKDPISDEDEAVHHRRVKKLNTLSEEKYNLEKSYKNLKLLSSRLDGMRSNLQLGEGVGRRLYKIKRNGQYGSSYIDIPLLKKTKDIKSGRWLWESIIKRENK